MEHVRLAGGAGRNSRRKELINSGLREVWSLELELTWGWRNQCTDVRSPPDEFVLHRETRSRRWALRCGRRAGGGAMISVGEEGGKRGINSEVGASKNRSKYWRNTWSAYLFLEVGYFSDGGNIYTQKRRAGSKFQVRRITGRQAGRGRTLTLKRINPDLRSASRRLMRDRGPERRVDYGRRSVGNREGYRSRSRGSMSRFYLSITLTLVHQQNVLTYQRRRMFNNSNVEVLQLNQTYPALARSVDRVATIQMYGTCTNVAIQDSPNVAHPTIERMSPLNPPGSKYTHSFEHANRAM
jgi:hypothetical protein